jgi:hypothetical protein
LIIVPVFLKPVAGTAYEFITVADIEELRYAVESLLMIPPTRWPDGPAMILGLTRIDPCVELT